MAYSAAARQAGPNRGGRNGTCSHAGYVPDNPDALPPASQKSPTGFNSVFTLPGHRPRSLDIQDRILCQPFLVVRRVVDARAIGGATVVALPVQRGRVVDLEKNSNSWRYDIFAGSKITSIPSAWCH